MFAPCSGARSHRTARARWSRRSRSRSASRWGSPCSSSTHRRWTSSRRACARCPATPTSTVRGPRSGFDEALYPRLARDPDVAVASPAVEVDVRVDGRPEPLRVLGLDAFRAGAIQPGLTGAAADRLDTLRPDAIFLSNAASAWLGADDRRHRDACKSGFATCACVSRAASSAPGSRGSAMMDIAAAQAAFDRIGLVDADRSAACAPARNVGAVRERIARTLPPGVAIDRPGSDVARDRAHFALLSHQPQRAGAGRAVHRRPARVLDAGAVGRPPPHAVRAAAHARHDAPAARACCARSKAALIGVAGSAVGVGAGYAIALVAVRIVGGDLGSGYFRGVGAGRSTSIRSRSSRSSCSAWRPRRSAASSRRAKPRAPSPARALKAGDEESALERLRSPVAGPRRHRARLRADRRCRRSMACRFSATPRSRCLLIGTLLLMPRLRSAGARAPAARRRMRPPRLRSRSFASAPGQASISLASIVASVSLMVSMAIMVTSFRQSLDDWLGHVLPASLYARVPAAEAAFTPDEQATNRARCPASRAPSSCARNSCCSMRRGRGSCCSRAR